MKFSKALLPPFCARECMRSMDHVKVKYMLKSFKMKRNSPTVLHIWNVTFNTFRYRITMISGAMALNRLTSNMKRGRLSSLNFIIVNYIEKLKLELIIIVRRRSDIDLFTPFKGGLYYMGVPIFIIFIQNGANFAQPFLWVPKTPP